MAVIPDIDADADPRVRDEYVRSVPGASGTVTLVGVVHDHPASVYRVQRIVETIDPAVLALELPPVSVPLFEQYAATERRPPAFGGEMSAAIQAASTDRTVGIDRPTRGYFRRLARTLLTEQPSRSTVREVVSTAVGTTKHALACRVAAAVGSRTSLRVEVDSPVAHDVNAAASPETQAHDEREQVERARSFMNAFRTASRSRASRLEDSARESEMARRLSTLGEQGDVVAVVGIDHLEGLVERLETPDEAA
jgi:pheromone shutdown protein TraB